MDIFSRIKRELFTESDVTENIQTIIFGRFFKTINHL